MAKKADLLEEAKALNLEVTDKNTIVEIEEAIAAANKPAEKTTAKSGKRSAKGLQEAEAKAEKIEAQHHRTETEAEAAEKPKQHANPTRSRLERQGKKFRKAAEAVDKDKTYTLKEAIDLAQKTSPVKFDATVEMHLRLGVDPRHADQNIRDNLVLPAGTGKTVRVAVFAEADDAATAKKAGADLTDAEQLVKELEKGIMNFDTLIATPAQMPKLGKYARVLGPRGLMPNPKSGTVTTDVAKAVHDAKAGRVEYRVDSAGIVHLGFGKVSFTAKQLSENIDAVIASIKANKPNGLKGNYFKALHITTSMGPSVSVDVASL
ncbi:50S ribosomal protein L1 [Candidatus Saccharibacteria bacterium]|nr:50S ribosomal protein L1 [Candidatus Saccharibacteria bacterium]